LEGGKGMDGRGREGSGKSLLLREARGDGKEGGGFPPKVKVSRTNTGG